jgi:uncharacterized membrane protein
MEPNPYESPKQPQPANNSKAKLAVGAVIIAILTPIAIYAAFVASCNATDRQITAGAKAGNPVSVPGAIVLCFAPPLGVLISMLAFAWWLYRKSK